MLDRGVQGRARSPMFYGLLGTGPWQLHLCDFIFVTPKHLDGEEERWANLPDVLSTWQQISRCFLCKVTTATDLEYFKAEDGDVLRNNLAQSRRPEQEGVLHLLSTRSLLGAHIYFSVVSDKKSEAGFVLSKSQNS